MVAAKTVSSLQAVILVPSFAVSLAHFAKLQKLSFRMSRFRFENFEGNLVYLSHPPLPPTVPKTVWRHVDGRQDSAETSVQVARCRLAVLCKNTSHCSESGRRQFFFPSAQVTKLALRLVPLGGSEELKCKRKYFGREVN